MTEIVTIEDIRAAAQRIAPAIVRTPLLRCDALDQAVGAKVFVKAECLQRHGAFKFRGAFNGLASLTPAQRAAGVIAFSSGNHAIAVAAAAQMFNAPAVIVMPSDAPAIKRETTAGLGAEVVLYDRVNEDREAIGAAIAKERGLSMIKPFDDARTIAGQGTIGLEIVEDLAAQGLRPDHVLVCVSGGGLAAGIAVAVKDSVPGARVYPVEPEGHDDFARSLQSGGRERNAPGIRSIADALMADQPGEIVLASARALLSPGLLVSDEDMLKAMAFAFRHLKLVLEPGGAAALAAALKGNMGKPDDVVVVIASGGNVDPVMFRRALDYA